MIVYSLYAFILVFCSDKTVDFSFTAPQRSVIFWTYTELVDGCGISLND